MSLTKLTVTAAGAMLLCAGIGADGATTPPAPERKQYPISAQPLHPDVLGLANNADLVARDAGFQEGGVLAFELVNRGKKAANASIAIDVYVDNVKRESVVVGPLWGDTQRHTRVPLAANYLPAGCGKTRNVSVVVDPQNVVPEFHDDNNRLDSAARLRCPDLAVESIRKNMNQLGTEYVAEVKLINKGDASAPRFSLLATAGTGSIIPLTTPGLTEDVRGPLGPGQTLKFSVGSAFAHETMYVLVLLDRAEQVAELDESNNKRQEALD